MRRTAVILLALFMLPATLVAQEPGTSFSGTHTVQRGETLGSIAQRYLGSAGAWSQIFEANRDRIVSPDRITPGLVLVIPGSGTWATQPGAAQEWDGPATVLGISVDGQELSPLQQRQALARRRDFEPAPSPAPTRDRTIFFLERDPSLLPPVVQFASPDEVTAFPEDVFHAAGWIQDQDESLGELVAFAGDQDVRMGRTTVHPYDDVRIRWVVPGTPEVGDRFVTVRARAEVAGVGQVLSPTGLFEVRRVDEAGVVARAVAEYDRVEIGQAVVRPRVFPLEPGVVPQPVEPGLTASLLTFETRKELYLPGDLAFIDVGRDGGLAIGDELVAWTGDSDGWEGRVAARFQVVGLQARTSTVRITTVEAPLALLPGLRLHVDRKMP